MDNDKSTIELIGEARKTTSFYFTQFPKDATEQEPDNETRWVEDMVLLDLKGWRISTV